MIETTIDLLDKYGITFGNRCRVFVDGANPSFSRALNAALAKTLIMNASLHISKHLTVGISASEDV